RNLSEDLPDALDTPIEACVGWLQLLDLRDLPARHVLTRDDLAERGLDELREGDIAGIFGRHKGAYQADEPEKDPRVRLSIDSMEALVERNIRAVCMDNSTLAIETTSEECRAIHELFLGRGLPILENFYKLNELPVTRA